MKTLQNENFNFIFNQMWITARDQGKKSACYFWPGSDVNQTAGYPDYWQLYDGNVAFETRMQGALNWLDLPQEERFCNIIVYNCFM